MTLPADHLTYNRNAVAAALRRLADTATEVAELYLKADCIGDEEQAINRVHGRIDSVKHALAIVHATRAGIHKAANERRRVA